MIRRRKGDHPDDRRRTQDGATDCRTWLYGIYPGALARLLGRRARPGDQTDSLIRRSPDALDGLSLSGVSRTWRPSSLHFSPRGEAKCVRGPSAQGASRLARAGVLAKSLPSPLGSRNTAFTVHCPSDISSGASQTPSHGFHESRVTKHESRPFSRASTVRWWDMQAKPVAPCIQHYYGDDVDSSVWDRIVRPAVPGKGPVANERQGSPERPGATGRGGCRTSRPPFG